MYATFPDPYCYAGNGVLKNIPGFHRQTDLDRFEAAITAQRATEPLPSGRLSVHHYRAIHRHLFQDVYRWAGRFRTVRLGREGSVFCYPEHIVSEMRRLFEALKAARFLRDLGPADFVTEGAHFLATLNAIHPFREGNGRTQLSFMALLANHAGHPLRLSRLEGVRFLKAMITSFSGDEEPLINELARLVRGRR